MQDSELPENDQPATRWKKLERTDRRVAGVLVEKAKTTPENYPLTLNSIINACNQKSNRFPQMQLDEGDVDESLDRLRAFGAVMEVQGDGRVDKFRHLLYEWLGVDKYELAVMAELLLRGAQTLGELRGRAARMEKISGISDLRPIIDSLYSKSLIHYLTPPGRGCVVTHALYQDQELDKVRSEYGNVEVNVPVSPAPPTSSSSTPSSSSASSDSSASSRSEIDLVRAEVASVRQELKEQVGKLRADLDHVRSTLGVEQE